MKKNFVLTLEFEAEIKEKIPIKKKMQYKYFDKFLKEFLKSDKSILELYRNLLMSDLRDGFHIYEVDRNLKIFKDMDEISLIEPSFKSLPGKIKEHFQKIFTGDEKKANSFFEDFLDHFGDLRVKNGYFKEKNGG